MDNEKGKLVKYLKKMDKEKIDVKEHNKNLKQQNKDINDKLENIIDNFSRTLDKKE